MSALPPLSRTLRAAGGGERRRFRHDRGPDRGGHPCARLLPLIPAGLVVRDVRPNGDQLTILAEPLAEVRRSARRTERLSELYRYIGLAAGPARRTAGEARPPRHAPAAGYEGPGTVAAPGCRHRRSDVPERPASWHRARRPRAEPHRRSALRSRGRYHRVMVDLRQSDKDSRDHAFSESVEPADSLRRSLL